jgi:hypothetical protein
MTSMIRFLLLIVVLTGATPGLVAAQEQNAAPAAIPGLTVVENEAATDFPQGITFTLDAETEDPIAAVELLYRSPGVETYSVELPPFQAGATELEFEHPVDLRAGQLPPGIDVEYHWRIVEADGDIVETPEETLLWADDRFDWTPLVGPSVSVYAYEADPAFQQEILDTAERTIARLAETYDSTLDQHVRIWVYANKDDYAASLPPSFVQWTAGFNRPDMHLVTLVLPSGNTRELKRVVPHEISHQVLYQATDNPFNGPPGWLEEGLAVYSQETGRESLYSFALKLGAVGDVPSLRTLNGPSATFPYDHGGATAAYALSLTAVTYILDTWGAEGMARLIAAFPEGVTYEDAVQQALGVSFDELDRQWRDDLIADAAAQGVGGATRFGDDGPALPGFDPSWERAIALASGTLILGLVVLFAISALAISRLRHRAADLDEEPEEASLIALVEHVPGRL